MVVLPVACPIEKVLQPHDGGCFYPELHVLLNIPFWLPKAPPPMLAARRRILLQSALKDLSGDEGDDPIDWQLADLQFARALESVESQSTDTVWEKSDTIWHPDELVLRKGCLLRGRYRLTEDTSNWLDVAADRDFDVQISRRSIEYYDYGAGALEYLFRFTARGKSLESLLNDAKFWLHFKEQVINAVLCRRLKSLVPKNWHHCHVRMVSALGRAYTEMVSQQSVIIPIVRDVERLLHPKGRDQIYELPLIPVANLFALRQTSRETGNVRPDDRSILTPASSEEAIISQSLGIDFVLYSNGKEEECANSMDGIIRNLLSGPPVKNPDNEPSTIDENKVTSPYLSYVFFGSLNIVVVVRGNPTSREATAALQATRHLVRYIWLYYSTLSEASRGLISKQIALGLGYPTGEPRRKTLSEEIVNLQQADQLAHILIGEFHADTFWDTEIEQDIYARGFKIWGLERVISSFRENLSAVTQTEQALYRRAEGRKRQRNNQLLGALTGLVIISAINEFFNLGHWENQNDLFLLGHHSWEGVAFTALAVNLIFLIYIFALNKR